MKRKLFILAAALSAILSSFTFSFAPNDTVELYIINNCGREIRVRVQSEGSASSQTFYKNEERRMFARVGSSIEADGKSVFTVEADDKGAKVYLCN